MVEMVLGQMVMLEDLVVVQAIQEVLEQETPHLLLHLKEIVVEVHQAVLVGMAEEAVVLLLLEEMLLVNLVELVVQVELELQIL
jgi:hypothetical protein